MKNLPAIQAFVDEMMANNKRNYKKDVLKKWLLVPVIYELLQLVYNQFETFGVTAEGITNRGAAGIVSDCDLMRLLNRMSQRLLSGNAAYSACNAMLESELGRKHRDILLKIFDKDLKLGVDASTINEVRPGMIPVFDVALAQDMGKSASNRERLESEKYLILRKMDGVRCITFITKGRVIFRSRKGLEFTSLIKLTPEVTIMMQGLKDMVLDGELCVVDENGNENFKQACSEIRRKDYIMQRPMYKVFDILTLDEFYGITYSPTYAQRLSLLHGIFERIKTPLKMIKPMKGIVYTKEKLEAGIAYAQEHGWEGLMLRADVPYRSGRTSDLLKAKLWQTDDFKIVGMEPTRMGVLNKATGRVEDADVAGKLIIEYKGEQVGVGTGWSLAQRVDAFNNPENYIGRVITVQYQGESKDKNGKVSLRIPSVLAFRDTGE